MCKFKGGFHSGSVAWQIADHEEAEFDRFTRWMERVRADVREIQRKYREVNDENCFGARWMA